MPFDAQHALKEQRASVLDTARPVPEDAAPASRSAAEPASSTEPVRTPGRFQRGGAAPAASAPPSSAPQTQSGRFQRAAPAASSSTPSPAARPPAASEPQTTASRVSNPAAARTASPAPAQAASAPAPAPTRPLSRPAAVAAPEVPRTPAPSRAAVPLGYANRVGAARRTSRPELTPRLELYIDELAFQRGWSDDEITRRKDEAVKAPVAAENEYRAQFEEIRQLRQNTIQSLQQGLNDHPNEVVFVIQRGEKRNFSAMPQERAGSYRILHGSAFHSMPASATLFESPDVLFPKPVLAPEEPVETPEVTSEAAPAAPAVEATAETPRVSRPPRP